MKITHLLFATAMAVSPLFFLSCKKDSTSKSTGIKYELQTTNRTSIVNRTGTTTAGNLVWTSGSANASEIKFEATSGGQDVEYKSEMAQHIDLFNPAAVIGNISLPAGTYDQVEFKIELNPSGTDPALQLNGQFTNGAVTIPVVLTVTTQLEIKTEQNNVVIANNTGYTALTTLALTALTNGITAAMLNGAVLTNGTLVISPTSNSAIYNMLINNFDDSDEVEFEHD